MEGNWIWLAGLLEGEGYFGATKCRNSRYVLRVTLNMCDGDVVRRAAAIVGSEAKISFVPKQPANWKPTYRVQWTGRDAETIMWAVLPYMGERRSAAIVAALKQDAGHRPRALCTNGHPRVAANQRKRSDGPGYRCGLCQREAGARKRQRKREANL